MFSLLRFVFVAALLSISQQLMFGEDSKAPVIDAAVGAADQLYRAGKFAESEASYRRLLSDSKLVPAQLVAAQVGLVRAMLKQQKTDEALDTVNTALVAQPDSAPLLAEKGDVQFRRAEMSGAEESYLKAKSLDPKEAHAYLGLARLYSSYSMFRKAYDLLESAHEIAPNDIDVQRAWMRMLPRKERLAALESYLAGPHPDDEEETRRMAEYLEFLKATADKPFHACRLVTKVEQTNTKLAKILTYPSRLSGIGLDVALNDHRVRLQLDTGAGGIIVNHKVAEKAGLTRISAQHYAGVGDKGLQSGYTAIADHIRIGELEFQDCVISVTDKGSIVDIDGLIGADVFGAYLVDIDLPGMQLKLSPLPKRPEDAVTPKSLNSEGEEQANAEQKEDSLNEKASNDKSSSTTLKALRRLPKDRYVAPEMANWTRVFRFGHMMLVPTFVNDSTAMLFAIDTGAFSNLLSLRAARQVGKVYSEDRLGISGLNGEVNKVYSATAKLHFGHLQQPNMGIVTIDLSKESRLTGTEVSGFLGFTMLGMLEVKLDYRDGLVDFEYDPKRVNHF